MKIMKKSQSMKETEQTEKTKKSLIDKMRLLLDPSVLNEA